MCGVILTLVPIQYISKNLYTDQNLRLVVKSGLGFTILQCDWDVSGVKAYFLKKFNATKIDQ